MSFSLPDDIPAETLERKTGFAGMKKIGHVKQLWRYPVSSLGGEACGSTFVDENGLSGDRQFGLFDADGILAAPEKDPRWRPALFLSSWIDEEGKTYIRFPDGAEFRVSDAELHDRLSAHFGFAVSVGQYADVTANLEPRLPVISRSYAASPLHLLTTGSLKMLEGQLASKEADARRFRPSLLLATEEEDGFIEDSWIGAILHIGNVRAIVIERTKRCGMTLIAQPDLPEQPDVLRTILRNNHRCLGIYCDIIDNGIVKVGSDVFIEG
ncbi:MOSC domain-containing protein [Agrobacterium larrymoorei]|uniref:MOSC domain-containing protein n=1 Tax=Agrobacterium larrymoorei TaxID=160699 RepID=A0A4D7DX95_9HYPH|nr:MOSC N-terminal beta barrel domain-containing protein [Agrobacterium larrymoorei]QCI99449.1 MOSC domain-containing protein [Agrobacterium larrymoorei]